MPHSAWAGYPIKAPIKKKRELKIKCPEEGYADLSYHGK
jgi:hypothetical protein